MSTKPAITEDHINGRHDATSSQSMRVAVICALLAGAALLAIALLVAVGRGAVASPDARPITHVCANNASGQLFSLTSCKNNQTLVQVKSATDQFKACYQASNGVTRKVPESTKCSNKTTNKEITIPEVPADSDSLYFCVGTDGTMYFKGTTEPTCAAPQFAVVIEQLNDPPTAAADDYSVAEDGTLNVPAPGVLFNDSDPEGGLITAELVDDAANGTLVLNANGSFTYSPDANFSGTDSFTYKAKDSQGGLSDAATVTITVTPVNDAPVADDDTASVDEGDTVEDNVLANDTDVDGDTLQAVLVSGPAHASSFTLNPGGSFTYIHDGTETTSDSFDYKVCDNGSPQKCSVETATVNITINSVNDAPVANDASGITNEDNSTTITLSGTDADGDDLTFEITNPPDNGQLGPIILIGPSAATVNYTPNLNYNGPDSFTYKAKDGHGGEVTATISITVSPVNDAPSFTAGDNVTVNEDSGAYSAAWATAISAGPDESGQTLTFEVTNDNNALFSNQPAISADGTLSYTPQANAFGTATVSVTLHDDGGTANVGDDTSATKTFTITVDPVNDAPVANGNDGPYTVNEDTTLTATAPGVLGNDTDVDGDALSVSRFGCSTTTVNGILTRNADGSFSYTPRPNFNGTTSFTYIANDGTADSNCVTVNITVKSVNDPPVVDLDGEHTGIDTTAFFRERGSLPGFPPDTCCPVVLAPRTTVSEVAFDDTILESAEIKLTNRPNGNDESLSMDLEVLRETSIDSLGYDPETGILALFGPDTLANFEKVLRTVEYDNREESANLSDRLVTFKVNDGEADSQIATATVDVTCNPVPDPRICSSE